MSAPAPAERPRAAERLGPYAALDHRFTVRVDDPPLAVHLRWMLGPLAAPSPTETAGCYELVRAGAGPRYALAWAGGPLEERATAARALAVLMWHVNQTAIRTAAGGHVLLHAAAVARDGKALVLPAAMEAGKTTLAAGLIDRGWDYLTDEAAAVSLDGRRVRAYPKPLSIDPGSQALLAHWEPPVADDAPAALRRGQWHVPATARRDDAVVHGADLAAIVLPRYDAGASTTLTTLPRAATVARSAACAFFWGGDGQRARFAALAAAVRGSRCAELVVGDLATACDLIDDFWRASP